MTRTKIMAAIIEKAADPETGKRGQVNLAKLYGCTPNTISRWARKPPAIKTLKLLASVVCCSIETETEASYKLIEEE